MIKTNNIDFTIEKENLITTYMKEDGNLDYHDKSITFFLKNKEGKQISHKYFYMIYLGNDHFAVCNIDVGKDCLENYTEYDIFKGEIELSNPKFKWGIIRINRDNLGNIIPLGETQVFPCIYDRISTNNSKTATAYNNRSLTYLDIDTERSSYGQQLVPCILGHAVPFDIQYKGFAECSIGNTLGFLPRNCLPKNSILAEDLLTPEEVYYINEFLNGTSNINLDENTINKYYNLTGYKLSKVENNLVRRKTQ